MEDCTFRVNESVHELDWDDESGVLLDKGATPENFNPTSYYQDLLAREPVNYRAPSTRLRKKIDRLGVEQSD